MFDPALPVLVAAPEVPVVPPVVVPVALGVVVTVVLVTPAAPTCVVSTLVVGAGAKLVATLPEVVAPKFVGGVFPGGGASIRKSDMIKIPTPVPDLSVTVG